MAKVQRVSIYNERAHAKFPLLGLRFKNTSGLHLMQGPITVFEGSSYAGDSRVLDVQPNEERLLSYAVDLGTEVEAVTEQPRQTLTRVKAYKGILYTTTRQVESKAYRAKNRSEQDRTLLIEHPYREGFHLTSTCSTSRSAWPGRSRRCCPSSTRRWRASASPSTTSTPTPSSRCWGCVSRTRLGCT